MRRRGVGDLGQRHLHAKRDALGAFEREKRFDHQQTEFVRLARHRIGYVFLPENRTQACISGMESLITSERIVFQAGDAYLLELSTP